MMVVPARWWQWLWCLLGPLIVLARADGTNTNVVRFSVSAPYSSNEELSRRFGTPLLVPGYDLAEESFRLIVPPGYTTNSAWGLMVWLGPNDDVVLPPDWETELARQRVIFVAPSRCGHNREAIDRLRLALDATCNVCRRYRIDRRRIFVGGFSSGACLAATLGIGAADIFTGTFCIAGVNFYRLVPASNGEVYQGSFYPNPGILQFSRLYGRFVFVTSDDDPNREVIKATVENGFRRDGFNRVLELDVNGLQLGLPSAKTLATALGFLAPPTNAPPAAVKR